MQWRKKEEFTVQALSMDSNVSEYQTIDEFLGYYCNSSFNKIDAFL